LDTIVQEMSKSVQECTGSEGDVDIERMERRLESGWRWFLRNAGHPEFREREDQWIRWLREYERECCRSKENGFCG